MADTVEVAREEQAKEPSPTVGEFTPMPGPSTPSFGDFSAQIAKTLPEWQASSSRVSEAISEKGKALAPKIDSAAEAFAQPRPQPPAVPQLTTPPSRQLHDFLAPTQGESPQNAIMKAIQAVGLFATGIGGAAKGDARGGLAALTGAMKGWQEGDVMRADRAFSDWQAKTEAAVEQWKMEHQSYKDIMEATNLSLADKFRLVELEALKHDNTIMAAQAEQQSLQGFMGFLGQQQTHADSVMTNMLRLTEMQRHHQATEAATTEANNRKAEELQVKIADLEQRAADRAASLQERSQYHQQALALQGLIKQMAFETPITGMRYYDKNNGEIRQISKREWMEDQNNRKLGKEVMLTPVTSQQVSLVERLSVAPPILNRIDQIIDKVNAATKGANLTTGLINAVRTKAGIDADLTELQSLKLDQALELAAALSGGQPRISILAMLRGEATPGLQMTAEAAHRSVNTARTTIKNRLQQTTNDKDSYEKLSAGLTPYTPQDAPKKPAGIPSGWSVEEVRP